MKRREYHGMNDSREYRIWASMLTRCTNPKAKGFRNYGARGVTVCDLWRESFAAFYAEVGPAPGPEYTLDRIEGSKGYEPGNVRWALRSEQARNRRSTHFVTFQGVTLCVLDWANRIGIHPATLSDRLHSGWTVERALTERVGAHPEFTRHAFRGKSMLLSEWAKETGINENTLEYRIRNGWSVDDAFTRPPRRLTNRSA